MAGNWERGVLDIAAMAPTLVPSVMFEQEKHG